MKVLGLCAQWPLAIVCALAAGASPVTASTQPSSIAESVGLSPAQTTATWPGGKAGIFARDGTSDTTESVTTSDEIEPVIAPTDISSLDSPEFGGVMFSISEGPFPESDSLDITAQPIGKFTPSSSASGNAKSLSTAISTPMSPALSLSSTWSATSSFGGPAIPTSVSSSSNLPSTWSATSSFGGPAIPIPVSSSSNLSSTWSATSSFGSPAIPTPVSPPSNLPSTWSTTSPIGSSSTPATESTQPPGTSSPTLLSVSSASASASSSLEPATTITIDPTQMVTLTIPAHRQCSSDSEYCTTYSANDRDKITITVPDIGQATVTNPADWATTTILPSQEEDRRFVLPLPIWVPSLPCLFNCGGDDDDDDEGEAKAKAKGGNVDESPDKPKPTLTSRPDDADCKETFTNTLCTQVCTVIHQTMASSTPAQSTVCRQPSCGPSVACTPGPASTETVSTTASCTATFTNYFCDKQCTAQPATAVVDSVSGTATPSAGYSTTCAPTATCQTALQCSEADTVVTSTTVTTVTPSPTALCSPDRCGDACLARLSRRGDGDGDPGNGREILGDKLSSPDAKDPQPWWDRMRHLVEAYGADPGPPGTGRSRAAFVPFGRIDPSTNQFVPDDEPAGGGVWPMQGCTAISVVSTRGAYTAYIWESPTMTSFLGQPAWEQNVVGFFRDGDSGFNHKGKAYNRSPSLMQLRDIGVFNLYTMSLSDMWVHIFVRADSRDPSKPINPENVASLKTVVAFFCGYPEDRIVVVPYQSDPFDEPPGTSTPDNQGNREQNMLAWQFAPKTRSLDGLDVSALRLWFNKKEVYTQEWYSRMTTMCTPFACGRNMNCADRKPDPDRAKAAYDVVFSGTDFEKPHEYRLGENRWWKSMDEIIQVGGANYGAENEQGDFLHINHAKAQFIGHDFGSRIQSAEERWAGGIYQLNGCVGVAVISDQAIYTAHLWEDTVVAGSGMAAELDYNSDEELFESEVLQFLREGNDPLVDDAYISPGLQDMAEKGGAFDPDTRSFVKIYLIAADNEELSARAGAPTWAWEDSIKRLEAELLDILKTSGANVVPVHYRHRPDKDLDMISGTNRLAVLYSPWHGMEGKSGPAVDVYFDRRLVDEISWSNPTNKLGRAFGAEESQWSKGGRVENESGFSGNIDQMSEGKHVLSAQWSVVIDPEVAGAGMYDVRVRLYIDGHHFVGSLSTSPALWQAETISMAGQAQVGNKNFFVRLETSFVLPEGGADRTTTMILARHLLDKESTGPYCAARVHGSDIDPVTHKSRPTTDQICWWILKGIDDDRLRRHRLFDYNYGDGEWSNLA